MKLRYQKFPIDPANSPSSKKTYAIRPVIPIQLDTPKGKIEYLALIDSGADYCLFHASIGELMGIKIKSGKTLTFRGTSGAIQKAYFHRITFKISNENCTTIVGFSYDLEKLAFGLLGQDGFFDKWIVKFDYHLGEIDLQPI